ncbi:hypothetical protein KCU69_g31, partial [Aureobasidium melanogenum]
MSDRRLSNLLLRERACVEALSVDTQRGSQNTMPSDGYPKPCRSRGRFLKCDASTRVRRPNILSISCWLTLEGVCAQRPLQWTLDESGRTSCLLIAPVLLAFLHALSLLSRQVTR